MRMSGTAQSPRKFVSEPENFPGILRDHTPESPNGTGDKIWSDLHGDMQRSTEMIDPSNTLFCVMRVNVPRFNGELGSNKLPKVAKSLVG